MPATDVVKISKIDGVESAAGGLTLNSLHIEGTVPEQQQQPGQFGGPGSGGGGPPRNINATSLSVSGVDQAQKALGAVTPGEIVKGHYFGSGAARQAILNESYASSNGLSVGDTVKLGGKSFTVDRDRRDAAWRPVLGCVREALAIAAALRPQRPREHDLCAGQAPTT